MDIMTLGMLAVLVVLIFFMFRNNRKRQAEAKKLQDSLAPGARVMTNFGLYGTLVSIDETENIAVLKLLGTAKVEVHRQTIARVIEPVVAEAAAVADAAPADDK